MNCHSNYEERYKEASRVTISGYLESRGGVVERKLRDGHMFFSSPFSSERTPSFQVSPNDEAWYDFSSGKSGGIIKLVMEIESCTGREAIDSLLRKSSLQREVRRPKLVKEIKKKPFDLKKYGKIRNKEREDVRRYANNRCIYGNYTPVSFWRREEMRPVKRSGIGFPLENNEGEIVGLKIRNIEDGDRWSHRGGRGLYILDSVKSRDGSARVFISESETSSVSLYQFLKEFTNNFVVICIGSIGTNVALPDRYQHLKRRYIYIDYDGDEDLWKERLEGYSHLKAEPIKLALPKGEDINSLYCSNKLYNYKKLILDE